MSVQDITDVSVLAAIRDGLTTVPDLAEHFGVIPSSHTLRITLAALERDDRIRCAVHAGRGTTFETTDLTEEN